MLRRPLLEVPWVMYANAGPRGPSSLQDDATRFEKVA